MTAQVKKMTPAEIRNKVIELEEQQIDYAGTDGFAVMSDKIERIKKAANEEYGFMYNI